MRPLASPGRRGRRPEGRRLRSCRSAPPTASLPDRATVADEDVRSPVGVPGHEVGGARGEGHEATVGADRRRVAVAIPLVPGAVHAWSLGATDLTVVDEPIGRPV